MFIVFCENNTKKKIKNDKKVFYEKLSFYFNDSYFRIEIFLEGWRIIKLN